MKKIKIILAFSGGLDTSFCCLWLKNQNYEVITATVNTGGFDQEEQIAILKQSKALSAKKHYFIDRTSQLYNESISYIIKGNLLRGGVYPLCVGPERLVIAKELIKIANKEKAKFIAHGSTGAGSDQVRLGMVFKVLAPTLTLITPIRDLGIKRADEAIYLKKHNFPVPNYQGKYSINKGLLGTTIGGIETDDSWQSPSDDVYPTVVPLGKTPKEGIGIILDFKDGLPFISNNTSVKSKRMGGTRWEPNTHAAATTPDGGGSEHDIGLSNDSLSREALAKWETLGGKTGVEILKSLNTLGAKHGIGRGIHLGDTIIGLKGRIAFEAPGILILIKAHQELEKLVLTKHQLFWKDIICKTYADFLHEGLYFEPLARDIEKFIDSTQKRVTGQVKVKLCQGNIIILGCQSPYSLINHHIATYAQVASLWTGHDAAGFEKIYGLQSVLAHRAWEKGKKYAKKD